MKKKGRGKKTKLLLITISAFVLIFTLQYVSAYKWSCLSYGQSVPNDKEPRFTCKKDYCRLCLTDNNYPTLPSKCNDLSVCSTFDNGDIDAEPPQLTITSPIDNNIYNSRKVLFDIQSNELVTISYVDNIMGRNRWKKLQSLTRSYNRYITFYDGLNDITLKAVDKNGNFLEVIKKFYVDSKEPRIKDTFPNKGFVGGEFIIEYDEENVKEIKLYYGTQNNIKQTTLNNCPSGKNEQCSINIDLQEFNGNEIDYWFSLEDFAKNVDTSKKIRIAVDNSVPIIKNFEYTKDGRSVRFLLEIEENFLDEIIYKYTDMRGKGKGKEKKICSRIENGVCNDVIKLDDGEQEITIIIKDIAGNKVLKTLLLNVDSKIPIIKMVSPSRGFANGLFDIEFIEDNYKEIKIMYGVENEMRSSNVNDCDLDDKIKSCTIIVNLNDFNNKEIKFWFEIEDNSGNKVKSKEIIIKVDNQAPLLINENFWELAQKGKVMFNFEVTDNNFDKITYLDNSDRRPREKILCSGLKNNKCSVNKIFKLGNHNLDIMIEDKAGNAISKNIEFDIV